MPQLTSDFTDEGLSDHRPPRYDSASTPKFPRMDRLVNSIIRSSTSCPSWCASACTGGSPKFATGKGHARVQV